MIKNDIPAITFTPIAHIRCDFPSKFGLPRQSGLVRSIRAEIVFEKPYRDINALRGIEGFSHLWLIWHLSGFDGRHTDGEGDTSPSWSPMVRPPRLGGNERIGVFATRSPNRPNPIGLSCVKLEGVSDSVSDGRVLTVSGSDLMDGTPIFDIKPYLPICDSYPDAMSGFSGSVAEYSVKVDFPDVLLARIQEEKREALIECLKQDPRPSYIGDASRVYGFEYAGFTVRFTVSDGVLHVCEVSECF